MTTGSKQVLFSAVGLAVLLIAGLFIAQVGGGNGNSAEDGTSPLPTESSPSPDSSPTPSSSKEQVREAYLEQWDVYTQAVRVLETDGLGDVFTAKAFEVVTNEIKRRRREGTPLALRLMHDLAVRMVDATTAVVDDRYIYRATDINPETGEPEKRYPPDLIHELYTLKKVNSEWKVSAIFRQSIKPAKR